MTELSLFDFKIGSKMAEISINITISNICGAQQIFDYFEPAVEKRVSAFYVLFQPMPILAFCWLFRLGYDMHNQPARVLLLLINKLMVTVFFKSGAEFV